MSQGGVSSHTVVSIVVYIWAAWTSSRPRWFYGSVAPVLAKCYWYWKRTHTSLTTIEQVKEAPPPKQFYLNLISRHGEVPPLPHSHITDTSPHPSNMWCALNTDKEILDTEFSSCDILIFTRKLTIWVELSSFEWYFYKSQCKVITWWIIRKDDRMNTNNFTFLEILGTRRHKCFKMRYEVPFLTHLIRWIGRNSSTG